MSTDTAAPASNNNTQHATATNTKAAAPTTRATAVDIAKAAVKKQRELSMVAKIILAVYNCICFAIWSHILFRTMDHIWLYQSGPQPFSNLFAAISPLFEIVQCAAFIEVLFAILGWVPSSPMACFVQCFARCLVLFSSMTSRTAVAQNSFIYPGVIDISHGIVIMFAWSTAEVVRYAFYALQIISPQGPPAGLIWLRYTWFIVAYPLGATNEMAILWKAIPSLQETKLFSLTVFDFLEKIGMSGNTRIAVAGKVLSNKTRFIWYHPYFCYFSVLMIPVGFILLYRMLLATRRKALKPKEE